MWAGLVTSPAFQLWTTHVKTFNYLNTTTMEAKIKKLRTLTCIEGGCKQTTFVAEMTDGTRWYTTKGGHVALCTEDPIKSYTNLDRLCDIDSFTYYVSGKECEGICHTAVLARLVRMH